MGWQACIAWLSCLAWLCVAPVWAQEQAGAEFVRTTNRYRLVEGSRAIEECAVPCPRPPLEYPIRGELWLHPGGDCASCPLFLRVALGFWAVGAEPRPIAGKGEGIFRVVESSPVGLPGQEDLQEMRLRLSIESQAGTIQSLTVESGLVARTAPVPWIEIELKPAEPLRPDVEPPLPDASVYTLRLVAVPWPTFLFSTGHGMTPSSGAGYVSDGDLLSPDGFVVARNADLTSLLEIEPMPADLGLDAALLEFGAEPRLLDAPEILFSTVRAAVSKTLGPIGHGDLLSSRGSIALAASDWLGAFALMPPLPDVGLDAVSLAPEGKYILSTATGFFSERLGRQITSGDLITSDGRVFRSEEDLFAAFQVVPAAEGPAGASKLPGLDALFVWPHGEIWFSAERDFESRTLGWIRQGDLLSDTGRLVLRNREIVQRFDPLEELADFGLDAIALDSEPQFSECGFIVEGPECLLFVADCGGKYAIFNRDDFAAGDRVRVTGKLVSACPKTCLGSDACLLASSVEPCEFDGCGRLVEGAFNGCVLFEAESGRRFLIDDIGRFNVGDRVHVRGTVRQGCNSACVSPCVAIVDYTIDDCVVETCGILVDLGGGCIVLETPNGSRYLVQNRDGFGPGDEVLVEGVLAGDCPPAAFGCPADLGGINGCIEDNKANGPVGEVGFFRGDCDADGQINVTDAVYELLYLFSGGSTPVCHDSCDVDGLDGLTISDAVYELLYLFSGGLPPPPPFPTCAKAKPKVMCGGVPCPCEYPEALCR